MTEKRATHEELAREAAGWADGTLTLKGWKDAPEAVPRHTALDVARAVGRDRCIAAQEDRMKDTEAQEEIDRLLVLLRDSAAAAAEGLQRHHSSGVTMPPMIAFLLGALTCAFSMEEKKSLEQLIQDS